MFLSINSTFSVYYTYIWWIENVGQKIAEVLKKEKVCKASGLNLKIR
jgi:hypothetical protein